MNSLLHFIRSFILPVAILLGLFFHSFFDKLTPVVPFLIFSMLFISFSNVEIKNMKISIFHFRLLLFQLLVSLSLYFIVRFFDETIAQGILVTVLTSTATSAVVIAVMLGANINTMISYTLLSNLMVALVAPLLFSFIGVNTELPFYLSFWLILRKIFPLLVLPLLLALLIKIITPKVNIFFSKHQSISFYLWALSLTIVIGRTIHFIFQQGNSTIPKIVIMGLVSIFLCVIQFAYGRNVGKKYGDVVAGGQALGQKNTVLAIWMAQSYLLPLSSVVPALYVIWQNVFNSYQLWKNKK